MQSDSGVIKNTSDLRRLLIETIADVKAEKIDAKQARTVAALATTILHSAKLDLDVLRFHVANGSLEDSGRKVLALIAD